MGAAGLKDVESQQEPLLATDDSCAAVGEGQNVAVAVARDGEAAAHRRWSGHLLNCFGDCGGVGCGTFLMVLVVPFVAFGHNMRRAFGKTTWKHALAYFALLFFTPRLFKVLADGMVHTMCERPRPEDLDRIRHHLAEHRAAGDWNASLVKGADGYSVDFVDRHNHPHHIPFGSPESCRKAVPVVIILNLLVVVMVVLGLVMVVKRRIQMRRQFGIPGSACSDCMAWSFCTPCALCQETRTLWANNVEAGVWHGPTRLVRTDATGSVVSVDGQPIVAPAPHGAMSAAPSVPKQV